MDVKEANNMFPKIIDFDLATRLGSDNSLVEAIGTHPIQPNHYRAPEVMLGCGWDYSADIWNLGVLIRHSIFPGVYHWMELHLGRF